jgi:hypothetical protein
MAIARCEKCGSTELLHHGSEMRKRAISFLLLAFGLASVGAIVQLLGISTWPFLLYGVAGFVISQAFVKWQDHAACYCKACDLRQNHWFRS